MFPDAILTSSKDTGYQSNEDLKINANVTECYFLFHKPRTNKNTK